MSLYQKEIYNVDKIISDFIENNPDIELNAKIIESLLGRVELDIERTAVNVCKYIKSLENNIKAYDEEKKRLEANKKIDEKKIQSLEQYIKPYILEKNIKQIGTFKTSIRKSQSINILDEYLIPEDYKYYTEVCKIDKNKLKAAYKEKAVEGCEIIIKENLTIK
jgi:hypothetical protein